MKRILSSERSSAAIIGVCAFYGGVGLWGLTVPCLWFDEIFGVHAAEHTWRGLLSFIAQDLIHPPLFYLLLKIWIAFGGESLLWLRLFPVLFSVLALFPFLLVCRELKLKTQTIIIALLLLAVNGALIKYAQEVRMYSLLLFFSLMSIWLFSRYFIKGKSFTALIFVNILLVHTHYFGWLVVGSEVVAILIFQRIKIRQTLLMFALTFASFVPWMIAIYRATTTGSELEQNIGWIERPGITQIVQFVFDLIEPFYFQASNAEPASLYYISKHLDLLLGQCWLQWGRGWRAAETAALASA
ncbi:glycosyltransferase family 39 protein [Leptolyngbya sp. 15MV]|nr:glycosyltransferase family 39 protein [Leptolyngbya sp. 15MV]